MPGLSPLPQVLQVLQVSGETSLEEVLLTTAPPSQACLRGGMRINYVLRPRTPNNNQDFLTIQEAKNIQHLAGISRIFDKSKIGLLSNWKRFLQEIIRWVKFVRMLSDDQS